MPKNKFFFTVLLTLTLILGGVVLTVKAQPAPTPKLVKLKYSAEDFLRQIENSGQMKAVYVFNPPDYQRLFYQPANQSWSGIPLTIPTDVPAPYKGGQDVRSGVILPLIQNLLDNIDPSTDIGANTNVSLPPSVTIPIIKGLKNVCDQQCDDSRYNGKFQLCFLPRCTGGGKDGPPKKCTCASNLRWKEDTDVCHNQTVPGGIDGLCVFEDKELKERCHEYECGVTEECPTDEHGNKIVGDDCDLMPYNQNFSSESFNENNAFMSKYRSYSWIKDAYENCYSDNFVPSNYHPTWCDDNVSASDPPGTGAPNPPESSDDYKKDFACNNDDRRMMCMYDNKAMPALTKATVDCLAALKAMFYNDGLLGNLYKKILDMINEMLDELENFVLPPVVIGGGYKWSKTPEQTGIVDEPGFCLNKNVSTCSCGHILPFNGSTITNLGLRRKLLSYGVADANKYCVNTEGDPACFSRGYSWDTEEVGDKLVSRNTKVGMRNIYASRASYPGWVTHKGGYVHGATCAKRPKGSSIGGSESGSKTRTFEVTDKEFFFLQARYFADKIARGDSDELSYGGCDDRSNILYNHATAAHCERKGKQGIKCRSRSRQRFSSYACDIDGGVINQCKNGRVDGGRNTICQVCGPIYCGEYGLYSDTNTVRRSYKLGNAATPHYRFYRYYHPQGPTKYGGGDEGGGGTIDGSEIFYSYSSQICLGERCNSSYNDAVFTPRDLPANSGQVFDDITCPVGSIVDPCSQRLIANNWGGHRLCYESCCPSSDGQKCDEFPPSCPPGVCCEKTPGDGDHNDCRQEAEKYGYGIEELCSIEGDESKTVVGVAISTEDATVYADNRCKWAGTYDFHYYKHYKKSVAKSYLLPLKAQSTCYFCGCAPIDGVGATSFKIRAGQSGWWPRNAKIKHGDKCLTPEQKCAAEFNIIDPPGSGKLKIGYDGLAQAMDRSNVDRPVTLLRGITGMTPLSCVRCRCVAGDGICDGYSGDPNGVCKNYPQGTLDPDCDILPTPPPVPNCPPPATYGSCEEKPGHTLTQRPYNNIPNCYICVYKPNGCDGDGICSGLETCENCPQECGECPQMSECPDGYSKLCTGEGYPVTGLEDCKRCYDPHHSEQPQHGCQDDGYCNPLCEEKDADCEPETAKYLTDDNGCPYGYGKTKECGYGERHPLLSGCYACGCQARKENKDASCDNDNCDIHMKEFSCSQYDDQNNSGLHWKVVTLAQQQQIYRDSLCYGYQFFTAKEANPYVTVGVDVSYYDYQQRDAWMSKFDGKKFGQLDAKGGYRRCRPVRMPYRGGSLSNGKAGLCEYRCIPAMHQAIVLSCSEIDARFPHEYRGNTSDEMVFIPDIARSAGNKEIDLGSTSEGLSAVLHSNDARCGRYYRTYPKNVNNSKTNDINGDGEVDWQDGNAAASYLFTDWWQVGGNAYGNTGVSNYGEKTAFVAEPAEVDKGSPNASINPATKKLVKQMKSYQYALNDGSCITSGGKIETGDWQPTDKSSLGAGLQVTGGGNPTTLINKRTYRPSNQTGLAAEGGYQFSYQKQRALDFAYYRTLLDYEKIRKNGSSKVQVKLANDDIEETTVYRFFGRDVKLTDSDVRSVIEDVGDKKIVIFVESNDVTGVNKGGNFILDDNVDKIKVNHSGYLAVIAQKDFIIEPQVGYHLNTQNGQGCGINTDELCTPSFNGVVIARGLVMKREGDGSDPSSNPTSVDGLFNSQLTCDKRLVLKGAYAFWGKQPVVFTRTLIGCGLKKGPFSNDKASLNVHDARGNAHGDDFEGRRPDVKLNNKNAYDDYCRTGTVRRNGNGYYNYHLNWPDSQGGMYNNYNRLISATQLVVNQKLINLTPAWMRQNLTTRLEVR